MSLLSADESRCNCVKKEDAMAETRRERLKLSEIMDKKRPADVSFLKVAHEKLGIDGNLLLQYV